MSAKRTPVVSSQLAKKILMQKPTSLWPSRRVFTTGPPPEDRISKIIEVTSSDRCTGELRLRQSDIDNWPTESAWRDLQLKESVRRFPEAIYHQGSRQ